MENKAKKKLKGFYFFMTTIQKYYKYLNLSTAFAKNYHSHYSTIQCSSEKNLNQTCSEATSRAWFNTP